MSQTGYKGTRTDASQFGQIAVAFGHRNWRMARGSGRRQEEDRPPWPCPLDVQVALRLATGGRVRVVLAMGREALFCVGARPSPAPHWAWATQYRGSGPTQASSVRDSRTMAVRDSIARTGTHADVRCPRLTDNGHCQTHTRACRATGRVGNTPKIVLGGCPRMADTCDDCLGTRTLPGLQMLYVDAHPDSRCRHESGNPRAASGWWHGTIHLVCMWPWWSLCSWRPNAQALACFHPVAQELLGGQAQTKVVVLFLPPLVLAVADAKVTRTTDIQLRLQRLRPADSCPPR